MPAGVSARGTWRCQRCKNSVEFTSMGELRSHQWAKHRKVYKNVIARSRSQKNQLRLKKMGRGRKGTKVLPAVRVGRNGYVPNGDMRVSDLLLELQGQQKFMNDVVALIAGILARHEERQHT